MASVLTCSLNKTLDPTSFFKRSPTGGVSRHPGFCFTWHSMRATSGPSGVPFCKSFKRALHSSVSFHKSFEHLYLYNQSSQFESVYLLGLVYTISDYFSCRIAFLNLKNAPEYECLDEAWKQSSDTI